MKFKDKSLYERKKEFDRIRYKYPTRLPVIVEKHKNSHMKMIDKNKYLVENNMVYHQFVNIIRKRLKVKPEEAIFLTVNGELVSSNSTFGQLYKKFKHEDGFIYFEYSLENTFG
jgi:GABA(A) receptor-associated protein